MEAVKKPKVSVCVVTYNHEKYIAQCLLSLVSQKADFEFEVIVGDDCSTDRTREIVMEFARSYAFIKPLFHSKNLGPTKNYLAVHAAATGQYVAHVDGDDYALPGKLSALSIALDTNPNANMVWHRARILNDKTGILVDDLIDVRLQPSGGFSRRDLLACGTVGGHSASMYRVQSDELPKWSRPEMLDFYLAVERIGDGRGIWIEGFYGVYRRDVGIMSGSGQKAKLLFYSHLLEFMGRYPGHRKEINSLATLMLLADMKNFRYPHALNLWIKSFHPLSIIEFLHRLPLYKILRLPSP